MAQVIACITELQALPEDLHLFCPRRGSEDGSCYFPEDLAGTADDNETAEVIADRKQKIEEARERKWTALDALQVMAFDGDDAAPFQEWILKRFEALMTSCDVCIRVFHQSRSEWRARLVEQYDEENIPDFLKIIDDICLKRITRGLDIAREALEALDPKKRTIRFIPNEAMYAFFEALGCDALLRNEVLLQRHFDRPFQLVQTKKRLKLPTVLPSYTRFLFSPNEDRRAWAIDSWAGFSRTLLPSEFEWAVRDHFTEAMWRVQMNGLEQAFLPQFWEGVRLIISKVDKRVVTECVRALEGNFYKLMLDHFSLPSNPGFLDLIATFTTLLEKAPINFWDAMNAITPSIGTVVEQILRAPEFMKLLRSAGEGNSKVLADIEQAFVWVTPFLSSVKAANLTPACKASANLLFDKLQTQEYPPIARSICVKEGLRVLDFSFKKMNKNTMAEFVGQPTVNGMLETLKVHIRVIVNTLTRKDTPEDRENRDSALSMIQQAFTLESQSLAAERKLISEKKPSPTETPPSRPIWKAVLSVIDSKSMDLAMSLLLAGRNLVGLEPLHMKAGVDRIPPTVLHFNERLKMLSQSITDVIDRLTEMDPAQLGTLFEKRQEATAIMATLFSSTEDTRNSAVELLKVISTQDARRDALQHILQSYYDNALFGISESCRQILRKKTFAPAPSLIKTCSDIIDIMCNSQDGILRSRSLSPAEGETTLRLWQQFWYTLTMIFKTTEDWSNLGIRDKHYMMDFCRDTMQFADQLFDQCSIFSTAMKDANSKDDGSDGLRELLTAPAETMSGMSGWLRLRDEYLSSKSVTLISKLLIRLRKVSIEVDSGTLTYIDKVLSGAVKANLRLEQQAELEKALETHLGRPVAKVDDHNKEAQQGSLNKWMSGSAADVKARDSAMKAKLLASSTSTASSFQARREEIRAREALRAKQEEESKAAAASEFRRKRQLEQERLKQEKALNLAKLKKARGLGDQTREAGSGLEGLGILGKEQAAKGEGLMHSSDESDDDEDDFDADLFGDIKERKSKGLKKTNIVNEIKVQMPYKKTRVVRSTKDMRARLAPDLSPLHKVILGWDYFHEDEIPPNSRPDMYTRITNTFRTPNDYQAAFEPLLTLEAWQGFLKFREENPRLKTYEIRIVSRASVDSFQEVSTTMTHQENKDLGMGEGDVVLLSLSPNPTREDHHCLARVFRVQRKQAHLEVSYRVNPNTKLQAALKPNATVFGAKLQSITPLEREYGALLGLQYYDLCDEITKAKPSPLLTYKDSTVEPLINNYNVNKAQAKAIKSAIDNDAFTLIQGPPGSGKTKTIVAIVGAILSNAFRATAQGPSNSTAKKLLVCAPSNAAVDELVMRFKQGIKTLSGQERKVNIVRIGRSDAINANVQDVTLEELVNKKMGVTNGNNNNSEEKRKLFDEHKKISEQVRNMQDELNSGAVKGPDASKLQDDLHALRRHKQQLGTKIDSVKDEERVASRNADFTRRRAQESVLNEAHVICATLSGSGHDMFQNLSIEFETVIVDEAAQCVEMSALIPLKYGCAKCILVGDPKQLPPTVFSKLASRFQYEQSLFVRMQNNHPNDVHLLDTQYRMHPEISLFPSQTFYDGKLLDGDNMAGLRQRPWHASSLLGPYRFYDVQGQHKTAPKGHSLINEAEVNVAMQLYKRITTDYGDKFDFKGKIGIITPYKSQLRFLKERFSHQYGPTILSDVEFNTTDAFQGRESEIIIFSCVRASATGGVGFLQDIRRMNVGLTRAKSSLWVLGNSSTLVKGEFWRKMIVDAKERKRYIEGNVPAMLNKHSSAFPAPAYDSSAAAKVPAKIEEVKEFVSIKKEPNTSGKDFWAQDTNASNAFEKDLFGDAKQEDSVKREVKQEVKQESKKEVKAGKFKADPAYDNDIDMKDADSARSHSPTSASGVSTPAGGSEVARGSATPVPDLSNNNTGANAGAAAAAPERMPGDVLGTMNKPKIRKRKRPDANPLMQKPKRPRPG